MVERLPRTPAGDGGGGDRAPGRGPAGAGRGRDGGWRWPRPGAPDAPAPTSTPRHRPGPRRRGSGGRGTRTLRGSGPHRAGRLRAVESSEADIVGNEGIVAILFDLGVSSPQLDRPVRGFSYWADAAPLDMRMDSVQTLTAETVVNEYSEADLAALIARNGEERYARRIAAEIVAARPLLTTGDLVEAVKRGIPAAGPPARWPPGAPHVPGHPHGGQPRAAEPRGRPRRVGAPPQARGPRRRARVPLARGPHGEGALRRLVAHRGARVRARPVCRAPSATRSPACSPARPLRPSDGRGRGQPACQRAPACGPWSASPRDHDRRTVASARARIADAPTHQRPRRAARASAAPRLTRRLASAASVRCSRSSPSSRS